MSSSFILFDRLDAALERIIGGQQLSPGDELELELVKGGKDEHQAVGYLPDGTMIVVNQGKPHLGTRQPVVVAGAVQTSAGRLIFAELNHS